MFERVPGIARRSTAQKEQEARSDLQKSVDENQLIINRLRSEMATMPVHTPPLARLSPPSLPVQISPL